MVDDPLEFTKFPVLFPDGREFGNRDRFDPDCIHRHISLILLMFFIKHRLHPQFYPRSLGPFVRSSAPPALDAADDFALTQHVVIVVVPMTGGARA